MHPHSTPMDPRDPPVLVRDYPDPPLHLVVSHEPRVQEAVEDASLHLAKQTQQRERREAVALTLPDAADDLLRTNLLDAVESGRLADHMSPDLSLPLRRDAQAVAVRLHDRHWDAVSRYAAADVVLMRLRKLLSAHGLAAVISDAELRAEADQIAGLAHRARVRIWTGQDATSDTTWAKARLGILSLTEDR